MVEYLDVDRLANRRRGEPQNIGRRGEQLLIRREVVDAEVLDVDEPELLEVGVRVAPAATLIEPDTIREHLSKRALGLLEVEALERRLEKPLAA
ncbi:MAG: hypothetical protein ACOX6T_27375 [Myxococcales bacterium]